MWLAVPFFTYCALRELVHAIGREKVIHMFFSGRDTHCIIREDFDGTSSPLSVANSYPMATLEQMRQGTTLTLTMPPQRIPLTIPACGGRYDCLYDEFATFITTHVRQDCLITATAASREASGGLSRAGEADAHP